MDLCYLKHSELAEHLQKYKGRVVLRGDNVKDDTGSYAVWTLFLVGTPGEAFSLVMMSDASRQLPETEWPTARIRLPRNRRPKHWDNIDRLGQSAQLGMPPCSATRSGLCISTCRVHENGWKKNQLIPYVVKMKKRTRGFHAAQYLGCRQRESAPKESDVKMKSDLFAEVTTTDTRAKPKIKNLENGKGVCWSYEIKGSWNVNVNWRTNPWNCCQRFLHPVWMVINLRNMTSKL